MTTVGHGHESVEYPVRHDEYGRLRRFTVDGGSSYPSFATTDLWDAVDD